MDRREFLMVAGCTVTMGVSGCVGRGLSESQAAVGDLLGTNDIQFVVEDVHTMDNCANEYNSTGTSNRECCNENSVPPDAGLQIDVAIKNFTDSFIDPTYGTQIWAVKNDVGVHNVVGYNAMQGTTQPLSFVSRPLAPGEVSRGEMYALDVGSPENVELRWEYTAQDDVIQLGINLTQEQDIHRLEQELEIDVLELGEYYEKNGWKFSVIDTNEGSGDFSESAKCGRIMNRDVLNIVVDIHEATPQDHVFPWSDWGIVKTDSGREISCVNHNHAAQTNDSSGDVCGERIKKQSGERLHIPYQYPTNANALYVIIGNSLWEPIEKVFWEVPVE